MLCFYAETVIFYETISKKRKKEKKRSSQNNKTTDCTIYLRQNISSILGDFFSPCLSDKPLQWLIFWSEYQQLKKYTGRIAPKQIFEVTHPLEEKSRSHTSYCPPTTNLRHYTPKQNLMSLPLFKRHSLLPNKFAILVFLNLKFKINQQLFFNKCDPNLL